MGRFLCGKSTASLHRACTASGAAIGDIFAEFQKQGMSGGDAFRAPDVLITRGREGAFTLKDSAAKHFHSENVL
jgi:hypothetical protein